MDQPPATPNAVPPPPVRMPGQPSTSNGLAIAALVLGIVAFLFGWTGFFNLLVATLSVVFGIIALVKHQNKGFALTGTILGGIGLFTSLVVGVFFSAALLSAASNHTSTSDNTSIQSGLEAESRSQLTLDGDWTVDANDPNMTFVKGTVSNNTNRPVNGYVQISFTALDSGGSIVGDCLANVTSIEASGKWKFKAICSGDDIANVRFRELSGF